MKLKLIELKLETRLTDLFHYWGKFHFICRPQKVGITKHMDIYNNNKHVFTPNSRFKCNLDYIP